MKAFTGRTESVVMRRFGSAVITVLGLAATTFVALPEAQAQEIQLTGPLAGAPAVRRLRLHRDGRFEISPAATLTLLDEYRRTIMPTLRLNYSFFDWFGIGLFGGYGFQYNTNLSDELQSKAIDERDCNVNSSSIACKRSAVSLCRGTDCLKDNQLGRLQWTVAPQLTFVPFRGKLALFSEGFVDTDISLFIGGAIIGVQERAECAAGTCQNTFGLQSRVTGAPTFGLALNFYPADFMGFGVEYRAMPFSWNTSGFDVAGGGKDNAFPDNAIDSSDRAVHFTSMLTLFLSFQLPAEVKISD